MFNNFNFTQPELNALDKYKGKFKVFVNSNSFVELKGDVPAVVTINPYLDRFVKPRGKIEIIKAARVKFVAGAVKKVQEAFKQSMEWCFENNIPVLITYMRFAKKEDLMKFTDDQSNYVWSGGYYRQKKLETWNHPLVNYCDFAKEGCPSCMNCAKLTFGIADAELHGVNLSESGMFPFNCPSCFAKRMIPFFGIGFDTPTRNAKQRGMKHA